MQDDEWPPERTYGVVPRMQSTVPARLLLALCLSWCVTCRPSPHLQIVEPRRGTVMSQGDVTVVWRMVGDVPLLAGDHYHVFLDRDLPALGDPIPQDDPRIAHVMGDTVVTFHDVEPGPHRVTVVLGDASHRARGGLYRASVPFRVRYEHSGTLPVADSVDLGGGDRRRRGTG